MPLASGTRLGPYQIVAPIGAGGMGEVYRAKDTRLNRDVAVKVLSPAFAGDPDRVARFEREAQAVAALSHPNIVVIHDVGNASGTTYVVTELLDGETLRARLKSGPLPARKAIECAVQLAHGLAAAHDKGLVHRDLKPENVFVQKDGQVKILDFGLAKDTTRVATSDDDSQTPTATAATDAGTVLGTMSYMAPEQLRGQRVDGRSDLFALGAVLYEMLSGRRAFQRGTAADTMTAILTESPPDLTGRVDLLPAGLDRIVRRCLEKAVEERFQSARDLAFALEAVVERPASASDRIAAQPPGAGAKRPSRLVWALVGGLSIAVVVLAVLLWQSGGQPAATTRTLRLATGVPTGVYHAIGQGIADVLRRKLPNTQITVRTTDGGFQNVSLLDRGDIDLAFSPNDVAFHAVKTERVLGARSTHIAALCVLYQEPAQIVVSRRANIKSIADLRGKKIALGLPQSGSKFSSEILLAYFGLAPGDYTPSYVDVDAARQLLDGSLHALITWRAIPAPAFEDVFKSGQVSLLSLDAESTRGLRVANPFLVPVVIPAHVYANQDAAVSTVSAKAMLVARADLEDATVTRILEAIFSSIPDLIAHHPRASEINLVTAWRLDEGMSIDLHPAARKFFERAAQGKTP
jgi:TRAP transporter TAXI family solute receptor